MIVVGLYALLAWCLKNDHERSQRSADFTVEARRHRDTLRQLNTELWAATYNRRHGHEQHDRQCRAFWEARIAALERCKRYEEAMCRKYRLAASSPLRTITPDAAPPPVPPPLQVALPGAAVVHEPVDAVRPE
jgi:hypothetical protein